MAAPTIQQILTAIKANLSTISGLRLTDYVPDQVNPPQAVVDFPGELDPHGTFKGGLLTLEATVTVLVSKTVDRAGTAALAAYASSTGTNSIQAAIEADPTLGGVVDSCYVRGFRRLNQQEIDEITFFGGVFTLPILAKGS